MGSLGPARLSLRELARRAGVSPRAGHHFGDKAGWLTAVAAQGYDLLAGALTAAQRAGTSSRSGGPTCASPSTTAPTPRSRSAPTPTTPTTPRWRPRHRAADALYGGVGTVATSRRGPDIPLAGTAAWCLAHASSPSGSTTPSPGARQRPASRRRQRRRDPCSAPLGVTAGPVTAGRTANRPA